MTKSWHPISSIKPLDRASEIRNSFPKNTYFAHTMPGLEKIAWREIEQKLDDATLLGFKTVGEMNGMLLFKYEGDPSLLNELRTVEDVFLVVASLENLPTDREGLRVLPTIIPSQDVWFEALRVHREFRGHSPKSGRRTTFRVISRTVGDHAFYRKEAQMRVEKAIRATNPRWTLVEDDSTLEIWLTVLDTEAIIGLRLSDRTMRHRTYKHEHMADSLRPTVAASMVLLTRPEKDDVFLDPMCGAGTILIERALWGRYKQLLGGDIRSQAVEIALSNIGNKYKPIEVHQWDATELTSVTSRTIDVVVCNLPFGKQLGSRAENEILYERFLQEMVRVLKPDGRMVLLTGDYQLLDRKLGKIDAIKVLEVIPFLLLGVKARIFVLVQGDEASTNESLSGSEDAEKIKSDDGMGQQ